MDPAEPSAPSSLPELPIQDAKQRASEVRQLLQKKPFNAATEARRIELRSQLEQLLVTRYDEAVEKDIDVMLWKVATYQLIGEYRRRIALRAAEVEEDSSNARAQEELTRVVVAFTRYLADSTRFYRGLITKMEELFSLERVRHALRMTEPAEQDSLDLELVVLQRKLNAEKEEHRSVVSCHRWLVVLGDLARYRRAIPGLEEEERRRHTEAAVRCYGAAAFLKPTNGNPHNQLAVIACRNGNELEQLYHYCRSLACREPFATALENLRLVYKNNEELFSVAQLNLDLRKRAQKRKGAKRAGAGPPKPDKLSLFLLEFVRVHGILFTRTGVRQLEALRPATLRDYETALKRDLVSERALLQLIAVNIFACTNVRWHPEEEAHAQPQPQKGKPNVQKTALKFTVEFMQLTINRAFRSQSSSKYLGPTTVFFEWIVHHPEVIKLGSKQDRRGWTFLWKSACQLFTNVAASRYISPEFTALMKRREGLPLLAEEQELRGFQQLEEAHAKLPIVSTYAAVPSTLSRQDLPRAMRPTKLLLLAQALAAPPLSLISYEEDEGLFYHRQRPGSAPDTAGGQGQKRQAAPAGDGARGGKAKKLSKRAAREQKQATAAAGSPSLSLPLSPSAAASASAEESAFSPGQGPIVEERASGAHSAIGSGRAASTEEAEQWLFGGMRVAEEGPGAAAAAAAAAAISSSAAAAVLPGPADTRAESAEVSAAASAAAPPLSLFGAPAAAGHFGCLLRDGDAVMAEPRQESAAGLKSLSAPTSVWGALVTPEPEAPHSFFSALVEGTHPFNSAPAAKTTRSPSLGTASIWGWDPAAAPSSGWPGDRPTTEEEPQKEEPSAPAAESTPYIDWNARRYKPG